MNHSKSRLIGGLDEVGRGSLAGPMIVGLTVFSVETVPCQGINDSKKTSKKGREKVVPWVLTNSVFWALASSSPREIDNLGLSRGWQLAVERVLELAPKDMTLIVDGDVHPRSWKGDLQVEPKADANHWQVGAASILAKEARDFEMTEMAVHYPGYLWEQNAGYGSQEHRQAIMRLGATPYHRRSFLKKLLNP